MKTIKTSTLSFSYKEPLKGPAKKTVFYFSLSADNSLNLSPFCHPVNILLQQGVRVVSVTLPCHEENARPYNIQELWGREKELLIKFLQDLKTGIKELTKEFATPFGVMGLSRGSLIALHLLADIKEISAAVCFAPLLTLKDTNELSTTDLIPKLASKKVHFFVGDMDTLIGTENVKHFSSALRSFCHRHNTHDTNIQTKISPSIGRFGHGTSDANFEEGALWLSVNL